MGEYRSNATATTRGSAGMDLIRAGLIWSVKTRGVNEGEVGALHRNLDDDFVQY